MTDAKSFVKGMSGYIDLYKTVEKAGGDPQFICNLEKLQESTALEFLTELIYNNIGFYYKGE